MYSKEHIFQSVCDTYRDMSWSMDICFMEETTINKIRDFIGDAQLQMQEIYSDHGYTRTWYKDSQGVSYTVICVADDALIIAWKAKHHPDIKKRLIMEYILSHG